VSLGRLDFHIQLRLAQFPRQPLGAAHQVLGVLGLGADAGDAQKILQAVQRLALMRINIFQNTIDHGGCHHKRDVI
jgi:hypothetical protein